MQNPEEKEIAKIIEDYVNSMLSRDARKPLLAEIFYLMNKKGKIPTLLDIFYFFLEKREEIYENEKMAYASITGNVNFSAFEGIPNTNVRRIYEGIIKEAQNKWLDYKVEEFEKKITLQGFLKDRGSDMSLLITTIIGLLEKDYRETLDYYLKNAKEQSRILALKIIKGEREDLERFTPGYLREGATPPGVSKQDYLVEIYLQVVDILISIFKRYGMKLEEIFPRAFYLISVNFRDTMLAFYSKLKRIALDLFKRQKNLLSFRVDLLEEYHPEIVSLYNREKIMEIGENIIEEKYLKENREETRYQQIKNKSTGEIPNPYILAGGEKRYFLEEKGRARVDAKRKGACRSFPFMITEEEAGSVYVGEEKVLREELYPGKICPSETPYLPNKDKTYFLTEENYRGEMLSEYCERERDKCPLFYDPLSLSEKYTNREAKTKLKEIQLVPEYFIAEDQKHLTKAQLQQIFDGYLSIVGENFVYYMFLMLQENFRRKYGGENINENIYLMEIDLDNGKVVIDDTVYFQISRRIFNNENVYFFPIIFEYLRKGSDLPKHIALLIVDSRFKKISFFLPESFSNPVSSFIYYKFVNNLLKYLPNYQIVEPAYCPSLGPQAVGNSLDKYCNIWIFFYMENYLNFRNYALEKSISLEDYDHHQEVFASLLLEKSKEAGFVVKAVISYLYYLVENTRRYLIIHKMEKDELGRKLFNKIEEVFASLPYYAQYVYVLEESGLIFEDVLVRAYTQKPDPMYAQPPPNRRSINRKSSRRDIL